MAATSTGNQHGGIAKTQVKCVAGGLPFLPGKGFLFSPPCVPVICVVYKSRGILGCNFFVWHLLGLNCQLLMGKINLSKCIAGIRLEGHPRWDARFTVVNCDWCISFCFGTAPRPKVPRDTYGGAPEARRPGPPSSQLSPMLCRRWVGSDHWTKIITLKGLRLHWCEHTAMPLASTPA